MNSDFLEAYGLSISNEQFNLNQTKKVVVGMSGGVDSSVTAAVCKALGFETIGIFMRNWEEIDEYGKCSAEDDYQDVVRVCEQLAIPYYAINLSEEYRENVFEDFLKQYQLGNTPNPDILCNKEIKFNVFYDHALSLGADYLATGHYCQIKNYQGKPSLYKGKDKGKDQTYFLYAINSKVLEKVLFPIGHLEKFEVREIAEKFGLATSSKKDSTGICFIGERNFKEFLSQYLESQRGDFINIETQEVLGPHDGQCFYTIGQRKGLGIGGPGGPWFVVEKDNSKNIVFLGEGEEHPALYSESLIAVNMNWLTKPDFPLKCKVKIRYRQPDQGCEVIQLAENKFHVLFESPQRAIALQQSVVFYSDDLCLGGGIIQEKSASFYHQGKPLPQARIV